MKTKDEWMQIAEADETHLDSASFIAKEYIPKIQLDAMKEGAIRALVKIAKEAPRAPSLAGEIFLLANADKIVKESKNWTEKDL